MLPKEFISKIQIQVNFIEQIRLYIEKYFIKRYIKAVFLVFFNFVTHPSLESNTLSAGQSMSYCRLISCRNILIFDNFFTLGLYLCDWNLCKQARNLYLL